MRCDYYDAGVCGSCSLIEQPYAEQLRAKQAHVQTLLGQHPGLRWSEPVASRDEGFRNKAKMVVTGTAEAPTLGILDAEGAGVDLRECGLHVPVIRRALPVLADFVGRAALTPYDIAARRGELKHVLVTASPDGELMVRFVLRTDEAVPRIRKHLGWLLERLPHAQVIAANLQPEPKAVLEGQREIVLAATGSGVSGRESTDGDALAMRVAGMDLQLRPQSFFQTNTEVAGALYAQVRSWVEEVDPRTIWDLYCGVGGFALACAKPGRSVLGIEVSAEAVAGARASAAAAGLDVRFEVGDATALDELATHQPPDLIVVNPPRRGIGPLAPWLEASGVARVVYSSCRAESLASDLAAMPSLVPVRARLLDMFPNSAHYEVVVLLERAPAEFAQPIVF